MPGAVVRMTVLHRPLGPLGLKSGCPSLFPGRQRTLLAAPTSPAAKQTKPPMRTIVTLNGHDRPRRGVVLYSAATDDEAGYYGGESFYDILGLPPDAGQREIKKSYYAMMRECHPDLSQDDDESVEFCKMLNEIYETLMDDSRRALYDDLAGYSSSATNPFKDTALERDLVFVDEFTCIGCRNCELGGLQGFGYTAGAGQGLDKAGEDGQISLLIPPPPPSTLKTLRMEEEWGRARVMRQRADPDAKLQEAIDTCPVSCIHWVTAPQLTLLEAAMARMERVAVWSLMSGGGANRDVFTEASLAWEKRYANTQSRMEADSLARQAAAAGNVNTSSGEGFAGLWERMRTGATYEGATGSQFYERTSRRNGNPSAGEGAVPPTKEARSIASLAARAARASRSWRVYQSVERAKQGALQLSTTSSLDE